MKQNLTHESHIRGWIGFQDPKTGLFLPKKPNTIMLSWRYIVDALLRGAPDGRPYALGAIYIEYENNSGAEVTPPSYDADEGLEYYSGLSLSATRDYLRVPVMAMTSESDETAGTTTITVVAQTQGNTGVHGKDFTAAAQSRMFGGALVSTPVLSDSTQDIIFSRAYVTGSDQQILTASGQSVIQWVLELS